MKKLIFLFSAIICVNAFSQKVDTLSVEDMKKSFYDYTDKKKAYSLDEYKRVERWEHGNSPGYISMVSKEGLFKINGKALPQSIWKQIDIKEKAKGGKDTVLQYLRWVGFRTEQAGADTAKIRKSLEKKYAKGIGIPLKDFSGQAFSMGKPLLYGGFFVSNNFGERVLEKGEKVSYKRHHKEGSLWYDAFATYSITDGPWYKCYGGSETFLFQHDINRAYREKNLPMQLCNKGYSLLIYVGNNGKCKVHLLLPKEPTETDKAIIADLQKALNEQPAWIYGYLYTMDGSVMPGRYIEAISYGDGWQFKDYIRKHATD